MDTTAFLELCLSKNISVLFQDSTFLDRGVSLRLVNYSDLTSVYYQGLSVQDCIDEIINTPFFKDMSITESLKNVPEKDSYLRINDVMKYISAFSLERGDYVLNMGYVAHIAPYSNSEIIIHTKDVSNPECFMTSGKLVKHNSLILAIKSQDLCKIDKSLLV